MKFLQLKIIRILVVFLVVFLLFSQTQILQNILWPKRVYAIGDLTVNWGIGFGNVGPIFTVTNMAPGDSKSETVQVTNSAPSQRSVGVRGVPTSAPSILSDALKITIKVNGTDVYGGVTGVKSLSQFFTDSQKVNGIFLVNLPVGESRNIDFIVNFDKNSGNEFQNLSLTFDLKIGLSIELPDACEAINFDGDPIIGTKKADTINGTPGNDLILGLEGADKIDGKGGNDCILGGAGADKIVGGSGQDVLFGEEGTDSMLGGDDDDLMSGGAGGDIMKGGNGNDQMHGEDGADAMYGEDGDDSLHGGNGADYLEGGNNNDVLIGDAQNDLAKGGNGTDTCDAETKISCEL